MNEAAEAAPQSTKYPLPPLKVYEKLYCQHCVGKCSNTEIKFLSCVLTAILDLQASRFKRETSKTRGW